MFTGMCMVAATTMNNGKADKNGNAPVMLSVLAGKSPNRMIICGTIAQRSGFESGKTYLAQVTEKDANEFGRQFQWTPLKEVSAMEIIQGAQMLGQAEIFSVDVVAESAPVTLQQAAAIPTA